MAFMKKGQIVAPMAEVKTVKAEPAYEISKNFSYFFKKNEAEIALADQWERYDGANPNMRSSFSLSLAFGIDKGGRKDPNDVPINSVLYSNSQNE